MAEPAPLLAVQGEMNHIDGRWDSRDHRSWEPQFRRFSRSHLCIIYAARGYPPSQVPVDDNAYSQQRAVDDAIVVLNRLGVPVRYRRGCSSRTRTLAGGSSSCVNWGSTPWTEPCARCEACSDQRPSLYSLEAELSGIEAPVLILAGDEDDGCLETSLWLKRVIRRSGLAVLPKSGHTLNLEEPDLANSFIADFLGRVAAGAWARATRAPRRGPSPASRSRASPALAPFPRRRLPAGVQPPAVR